MTRFRFGRFDGRHVTVTLFRSKPIAVGGPIWSAEVKLTGRSIEEDPF